MARVLDYPIKPKIRPTVAGKSLLVVEKFTVWLVVSLARERGGEPLLKASVQEIVHEKNY
jgi:hypothetical protein